MNNIIHMPDAYGESRATGKQHALDAYMNVVHAGKSTAEAARFATQALLDDFQGEPMAACFAELHGFVKEMLLFMEIQQNEAHT